MIEQRADIEVLAETDGSYERPIPTKWRPVFRAIVASFLEHDYLLKSGVPGVVAVSEDTANHIQQYIADYGVTLAPLPDETWASSVCIWCGSHWDVLVDLWTREEGRSDLVLSARVADRNPDIVVEIHMVYVP
ncbi:hypothetical protein GTP45_17920 [Pseudoduganella sp. FT55W]|uniref:DUF7668 domain-containing protein n=2 Tax=Duganella rivi TaxID=2666083 RepID=A0A7X4GSB3_9BURK|nr:hypothetical protein [Duganella rivi]